MDKIEFKFIELVPEFLREDRNGRALALAIGWALEQMCVDVEAADAMLIDPDRMPEWALDEFAYNHGMDWYDRTADVEVKRRWVRDADYMRYCIGTKEAVRHLMLGFYGHCDVDEWYAYGGKPYEFRVNVTGDTSEALEEWAKRAIASVKNLRSIFGAFAHAYRERLELRQRDTFYLLSCRYPGTEGEGEEYMDEDSVYEGAYSGTGLDASARETLVETVYRIAGGTDAEQGETGMRASDRFAFGLIEYSICGDIEAL